ncbi:hypothetical protein XELAEV_18041269mg [Xenopus laevis]|uniref:Helix-turn-helix domain-containing protein n=1 Tax=Xenopus laevis TaxID=8355 RepID=A0A974H4W4_XENLA|nr:hypothetical protein XELAEV_18041269mg [Xenopus laevis]
MGVWEDINIWKNVQYKENILFIWKRDVESARNFIIFINRNDFNLRFSAEVKKDKIDYLDVTLFIQNGKVESKLYRKATDRNGLLHASSGHFKGCVKNIPKGQFLSARWNCSRESDFLEECQVLETRFKEKGYREELIQTAHESASKTDRNVLLKAKQGSKEPNKRTFFTMKQVDISKILY